MATRPDVQEVSAPEIMAKSPVVSVLTITYNHGKFIRQCVESAATQEAAFPIEIVVGEDCSPDDTRNVCLELQRQYPALVRLILPARNLGRHLNFKHTFEACRGRYVAILDGDDYWTDRRKLQKQVDFLDTRPDLAMCFHNVEIVGECTKGRPAFFFERPGKPVFTQSDFIERNFVPMCSCVFRRELVDLPEWYYDADLNPFTDWVLHVMNSVHGDAGYMHEVMAAHRGHPGGVWGSTFDGTDDGDLRRLTDRIKTFDRLQVCMRPEFHRRLRRQKALDCFHAALACRKKREWPQARRFLIQSILTDPWAGTPVFRNLLIAALPMLQRRYAGPSA